MCSHPPTFVPGSDMARQKLETCMIGNNTAITEVFSRVGHKFDLMYAKRAFIHWFFEDNMEEGELEEARENLATLEQNYEEMQIDAVHRVSADED